MESLLIAFALTLVAVGCSVAGTLARGPSPEDRLVATLFLGTVLVAVLLLLSQASAGPAARDVAVAGAVVAALLAAVHADRAGAR